jgi:5'-nucleotidase
LVWGAPIRPDPGYDGRRLARAAGGAELLATHLRRLEAASEHTLIVSAGDLISASPLMSALFHDEPTIEAMNRIGLDLNAVGNHEFDEGAAELRRMQDGGCHADGWLDPNLGLHNACYRALVRRTTAPHAERILVDTGNDSS